MNIVHELENKEEKNEIIIKYKKETGAKEIFIFGHIFVENNKSNCKIIYKDKEYEIKHTLNIINEKNKIIEIKLKGIKNVINMECMFWGCTSLLSLPDISKWNTSNVTNMEYMFDECSSLLSLPDISKWNTSNITNMNFLFYGCSSLLSLPDISKWDTNKVNDMRFMFYGCSLLLSLPDFKMEY